MLFIAGIAAGRVLRNNNEAKRTVDAFVTVSIFALLFLLGISVGVNDKIIENFYDIGITAVLLTIGAVFGSILLAAFVYRYFFRPGNSPEEKNITDLNE